MPSRVLVFLVVAACGGAAPKPAVEPQPKLVDVPPPADAQPPLADAPPPAPTNELVAKMYEFRAAACACHDRACAEGVGKAMATWGEAFSHDPAKAEQFKLTDAEQLEANRVTNELAACLSKFASGSGVLAPD